MSTLDYEHYIESSAGILMSSIEWAATEEGKEFWKDVHDSMAATDAAGMEGLLGHLHKVGGAELVNRYITYLNREWSKWDDGETDEPRYPEEWQSAVNEWMENMAGDDKRKAFKKLVAGLKPETVVVYFGVDFEPQRFQSYVYGEYDEIVVALANLFNEYPDLIEEAYHRWKDHQLRKFLDGLDQLLGNDGDGDD